mmetsp:Transcript_22156/g.51437  ORF Transcript_22156/g.51437 Transcript_22156/m.51437 type:complete len:181 (-) Transcript_22156:67-609(-)
MGREPVGGPGVRESMAFFPGAPVGYGPEPIHMRAPPALTPDVVIARYQQEIAISRAECERLASALQMTQEHSRVSSIQYSETREAAEGKEDEYKRMWSDEETRIKNLSEEARRQVEAVRARLIGGLERIDLSNRAMIEAAQTLQSIDQDLDTLFGEGPPATAGTVALGAGGSNTGLSDWA